MSKDKLKDDIFEYLFEDSVDDLQDKESLPEEIEYSDIDDDFEFELSFEPSDFNSLELGSDDANSLEPHAHHHHDEDLDTQEYFEELDMDYASEANQDILPVEEDKVDSFNIPLSGSPLQIKFNTGDSATPLQGQYPNSSYIDNNIPRAWLGILSYYG